MTIANTDVRLFRSSDTGAPTLNGTAGSLVTVLDACLVNGYGTITADSVEIAGGIATVTKSTGHGFTMLGTTGPVITIAGASPGALNGLWRIASVPSATQFTVVCDLSDQTASGTITVKRSPGGFSIQYTGTNKRVYKRDAAAATAMLLRVDDTPAQYPTLRMYESMSDIDTGVDQTPTSGSYYLCKSNSANATAVDWMVITDGLCLYVFARNYGGTSLFGSQFVFGDLISWVAGDAYCAMLAAASSAAPTGCYLTALHLSTDFLIARDSNQITKAAATMRTSNYETNTVMGTALCPYPNANGNLFIADAVLVQNAARTVYRGKMPGFYAPLHTLATLTNWAVMSYIEGLSGRDMMIQAGYSGGGAESRVAFDITGPWR